MAALRLHLIRLGDTLPNAKKARFGLATTDYIGDETWQSLQPCGYLEIGATVLPPKHYGARTRLAGNP